jgi:hypothetical protein
MADPDWPFSDPPETEAFTLARIAEGDAPIRLVTHDADDGAWQFLDGEAVLESDAALVPLGLLAALDRSILELADLPLGWYATRPEPGAPWARSEGEPPE